MSVRSLKAAAALGHRLNKKKGEDETKTKEEKCEDFDDILDIIGSQGRFQKFFLYAVLGPITTIEPILNLNILFMLYEPDHWCSVAGRPENATVEAWKNLTIPRESDGKFSQCEMYGLNDSRIVCTSGWDYDLTDYSLTIPSQYDWVCERSEWATLALTMSSVGNAFGTIVFGQAADKLGRKPIFVICLFLNIVGRIISCFVANNFYAFLALTFITGTGFPMIFIGPCMICAEISDKVFRAWIYSVTWMIWVIGMASLPLIAWLARDWFLIGLITTVPCLLSFAFFKWIPESPRWLLSVGKIKEAAAVIRRIAENNGTSGSLSDKKLESMLKLLVIKQDQSDRKVGVWTLFTRARLARNTTLLTISWVMNSVIYYAITLNASNLSGNQFLNFFILAIIELPAGYLGSVLVDRAGRRWTQVAFFILCTATSFVAGVAITLDAQSLGWSVVSVTTAVISKFAITLTFLVVYLQGTEVFPTQLRSTGTTFASTVGSVVGIITPNIVYLAKYNLGAPWYAIGVMSIVGVLTSAFLPETLNQALPETIEDAEQFGKGTRFWSYLPDSSKSLKEEESKNATPTLKF